MNIIKDSTDKIKGWKEKLSPHKRDIYIALVVIMASTLSYGLGRLSRIYEARPPISIYQEAGVGLVNTKEDKPAVSSATLVNSQNDSSPVGEKEGKVVASKNSDKYHLLTCPGAKTIKEENKIFFATEAEAEKAGLVRAGNCR